MLRLLSICEKFSACLADKVWECPSEYSRKEKSGTGILPIDRIQCISWAEDICGWLNKLTAQLAEPVKSTVMQYIDAIHVVADERGRKNDGKKIWKYYMSHLIIFVRE